MAVSKNIKNFSNWTKLWDSEKGKFQSKFSFKNLDDPLDCRGVYIIAYSKKEKKDKLNFADKKIVYIGMANSIGGLKQRLKQFISTIKNNSITHSGASSIKDIYDRENDILENLYVSIKPFPDTKKYKGEKRAKEILEIKGEVAKAEYECFLKYYLKSKKKNLPAGNTKDQKEIES